MDIMKILNNDVLLAEKVIEEQLQEAALQKKDLCASIDKLIQNIRAKKEKTLEEQIVCLFWKDSDSITNNIQLINERLEQWHKFVSLLTDLVGTKMYLFLEKIVQDLGDDHQTSQITQSDEFIFTIDGIPLITADYIIFPVETFLFRDSRNSSAFTKEIGPIKFDMDYMNTNLLGFVLSHLETLKLYQRLLMKDGGLRFEIALGSKVPIIKPADMLTEA